VNWCTVLHPDPQLIGVVSEFEITIAYWISSGLRRRLRTPVLSIASESFVTPTPVTPLGARENDDT
jgi:hypothetical protein